MGVNIALGQITGTTTAMQYSLNSTNGTDGTWTNASATNTPVTFAASKVYVRQAALPTNFHLVTTIAAAATAPTGVGIDVAAGQITGTTATQEYSLNGGTNWSDATATNTAVTFAGGNSVVVREKATASELASVSTTPISVAAQANAPTGTGINVAAGQITGTTATQEYSLNGGTNWNDATATNTAVTFTGGNSVVVREKATASALASVSTTPIMVAAPAIAPAANKVQGTNDGTIKLSGLSNGVTYEYVVDSNATLSGNAAGWSGASSVTLSGTEIDNIAVDAGQYVHLRVKATATHLASEVQNVQIALGDIKRAAAPNITSSEATNIMYATKLEGLVDGVTYEYIFSNSATLTGGNDDLAWGNNHMFPIPAPSFTASGTIKDDFIVNTTHIHIRVKATNLQPASEITSLLVIKKP